MANPIDQLALTLSGLPSSRPERLASGAYIPLTEHHFDGENPALGPAITTSTFSKIIKNGLGLLPEPGQKYSPDLIYTLRNLIIEGCRIKHAAGGCGVITKDGEEEEIAKIIDGYGFWSTIIRSKAEEHEVIMEQEPGDDYISEFVEYCKYLVFKPYRGKKQIFVASRKDVEEDRLRNQFRDCFPVHIVLIDISGYEHPNNICTAIEVEQFERPYNSGLLQYWQMRNFVGIVDVPEGLVGGSDSDEEGEEESSEEEGNEEEEEEEEVGSGEENGEGETGSEESGEEEGGAGEGGVVVAVPEQVQNQAGGDGDVDMS